MFKLRSTYAGDCAKLRAVLPLAFAALVACSRDKPKEAAPALSAPPSARPGASSEAASAEALAKGVPVPAAEIERAINPAKLAPYRGPAGTIEGTITVRGGPAPAVKALRVPAKCPMARDVYGTAFREGMKHALADVLVTVTGYDAFVPAKSDVAEVRAQGCTWGTRTLAVTFGQGIQVSSGDAEPYMPELVGAHAPATMVLVPHGDPVHLYPTAPGRYVLRDLMHEFSLADVFVLKFATHAVTRLDGKYSISGVPAGEVTVSALLPVTLAVVEQKVRVVADQTISVNVEIPFDKKVWEARGDAGQPAPQPSVRGH